jgi:hypothetical protein
MVLPVMSATVVIPPSGKNDPQPDSTVHSIMARCAGFASRCSRSIDPAIAGAISISGVVVEVIVMCAYLSVLDAGALPFWLPHAAGAVGRIAAYGAVVDR